MSYQTSAGQSLGNIYVQTNPPAAARSRLEQLEEQLSGLMSQTQSLAGRATTLADRILGSAPTPLEKAGADVPPASSAILRLERLASGVQHAIAAAHSHMDRLESL